MHVSSMKRTFRLVILEAVNHPRYNHRVRWTQAGRRSERFFRTRKEAGAFAVEKDAALINEGRRHDEINDGERRAILAARDIASTMEAEGITGFSLEAAVDHFAAHLRNLRTSKTVKAAVNEFLDHREAEAKSPRHLKDLTSRLRKFRASFSSRLMASITSKELDRWIMGIKGAPTTRRNYRTILANLFSFGLARGYCSINPVSATAKPKIVTKPPGILTPEQAAALLSHCPDEIAPAVAIGAFAGLRAAEIARLDWSEVKLDRGFIEVAAGKSKSAQRRLVEITDNLRAWLAPHARASGPVALSEQRHRDRFDRARLAAGIIHWPANGLRHSFASYHLAQRQNAAKTALQLGHSDTAILFAHYRELCEPKDGEAYFQIMPPKPKGTTAKIISIKVA